MVFLDKVFWEVPRGESEGLDAKPLFPLVEALAREAETPFQAALLLTDDEAEAAEFIVSANVDRLRRIRVADVRLAAP